MTLLPRGRMWDCSEGRAEVSPPSTTRRNRRRHRERALMTCTRMTRMQYATLAILVSALSVASMFLTHTLFV